MASRCVLIVEDEMCLAMLLEDLLTDGGYHVLKAARVQDALKLAGDEHVDAALLDVNLGNEQVYPVAERLNTQGVPFLFASAYGRSGIAEEYRDFPFLPKPYATDEIIPTIERLLEASATPARYGRPA